MANSSSGESLLTRIVRLLGVLDGEPSGLTVAQIAHAAELPTATAHRLVGDLIEVGWVERDSAARVRLGVRLWETASRGSPVVELQAIARPVMERVQAIVRQNTQLGVLSGDEVLFIECFTRRGSVDNAVSLAVRLPAFKSSAGLAIVAFSGATGVDRFVSAHGDRLPGLRTTLARIRQQGYAVQSGLFHTETTGISAPVRDRAGVVVAALSVVVPRNSAEIGLAVPTLVRGARSISEALRQSPSIERTTSCGQS